MNPSMACGHTANATASGNKPCCVICAPDTKAYQIVDNFDLTNRKAKCSCGKVVNSDASDTGWTTLAFFEFKGEGSDSAEDICKVCKYRQIAHERFSGRLMDSVGSGQWPKGIEPHEFIKNGPFEFDSFYCGCRGWN